MNFWKVLVVLCSRHLFSIIDHTVKHQLTSGMGQNCINKASQWDMLSLFKSEIISDPNIDLLFFFKDLSHQVMFTQDVKRCWLTGSSSAVTSLSGGLSLKTLEGMCSLFSTSLSCSCSVCLGRKLQASYKSTSFMMPKVNAPIIQEARINLINNVYSAHNMKVQ